LNVLKTFVISVIIIFLVLLPGCTAGDPLPEDVYSRNIFPGSTNAYDIGSPTLQYGNIYADNIFGTVAERMVYVKVIANGTALALTDNATFTVPTLLDGMDLTEVAVAVYAASTAGLPTFGVYNITDSQNMCNTNITIDANELTSYTAALPAVIDTSHDDVVTGDQIRLDCNVAGTGTEGWDIFLTFEN